MLRTWYSVIAKIILGAFVERSVCEAPPLTHDARENLAGRNHHCLHFAGEEVKTQLTHLPKSHDSVYLDLCLEAQLDPHGS